MFMELSVLRTDLRGEVRRPGDDLLLASPSGSTVMVISLSAPTSLAIVGWTLLEPLGCCLVDLPPLHRRDARVDEPLQHS